MATFPADPRRFSRSFSEFRVNETESETRFLATGNFYGIRLERNILILDWSTLRCRSCGREDDETHDQGAVFARTLDEVALECPRCHAKSLVPNAYAPDLVASRERKIMFEVYGAKSSIDGVAKMEFYRKNGFTAVTVPNEVPDDPEYSKPIFQLLALLCGTEHPERLFAPELG